MGEGMIVNFDGVRHGARDGGRPDEIITAEVRPDLVREARTRLGRREQHLPVRPSRLRGGQGRRADCPYTYMQDLVAGHYRLPWEDEVQVTDGTSCGFPRPNRAYEAKN